jgi:hypothetical protein
MINLGKLKQCPFCGSVAACLDESIECVVCKDCGAKGPTNWTAFGDEAEFLPDEMWACRKIDLEPLVQKVIQRASMNAESFRTYDVVKIIRDFQEGFTT